MLMLVLWLVTPCRLVRTHQRVRGHTASILMYRTGHILSQSLSWPSSHLVIPIWAFLLARITPTNSTWLWLASVSLAFSEVYISYLFPNNFTSVMKMKTVCPSETLVSRPRTSPHALVLRGVTSSAPQYAPQISLIQCLTVRSHCNPIITTVITSERSTSMVSFHQRLGLLTGREMLVTSLRNLFSPLQYHRLRSRDSSINFCVWLHTGRPWFDPQQRQRICSLAPVSRPTHRPTKPPIQWVFQVFSQG